MYKRQAQGLVRAGISVALYERDASARIRGQGYRIGIKEHGVRALRDCLPEHLFELCAATAIRPATRMVFLDSRLGVKFSKPIPRPGPSDDTFSTPPPNASGSGTRAGFGVNRLTLREILLAGLDGVVHFGKTFQRWEQSGDGGVVACFTDGSTATGDLLVGADGTGSAVRAGLIPGARLDDLGCFIYGRTPITPTTMERVPEVLVDSFNRMTAPDGTAVSVATCRTREPYPEAVFRSAPGVGLTPVPDYLAWTLSGQDDRSWTLNGWPTPDELRTAAPQKLHRLATTLLRDWHPEVRRIVAEAEVPATFLVTLSSARPVEPWDTPNVTLLGDAVHTMSPGRGEGANTALRDAALLRDALVRVAREGVSLAQAKATYEAEMLRYGFEAVTASLHRPFMPRPAAPLPSSR